MNAADIPINVQLVDLFKGEHHGAKFLELNPRGTVPALSDPMPGGETLKLYESAAIMRYLAAKHHSPLYPMTSPHHQARIDMAIESVLQALEPPITTIIFNEVVARLRRLDQDHQAAQRAYLELGGVLHSIDSYATRMHSRSLRGVLTLLILLVCVCRRYFKTNPYAMIGHECSMADVYLATYLSQITELASLILSPYPNVNRFFNNMRSMPHFQASLQDFAPSGVLVNVREQLRKCTTTPVLFDFVASPYSRIIRYFCKASAIELAVTPVNLFAGEQKSAQFLAANPSGKVPALHDQDVQLDECVAILKYLANKYECLLAATRLPTLSETINAAIEWIMAAVLTPCT